MSNNLALTESRSLRNEYISEVNTAQVVKTLEKAKALVWTAVGSDLLATTKQMAEYYEVPEDTVQKVIKRNREEMESDGLKIVTGDDLKLVLDIMSFTTSARRLIVWTPRSALRLGMLLRDSAIAKEVRTILLDLSEKQVLSEKEAQPKQSDRVLPPVRDSIDYANASVIIENTNNETLRQLLRDQLIDELSVIQGKKALASSNQEFTIAKVRARELGYSTQQIGNGSALGRWVAKGVPVAFTERVGKYEVKHYEVAPGLDTAIHTFFSLKSTFSK